VGTDARTDPRHPGPEPWLGRRLRTRILLAAGLAATLSVAVAGLFGTWFFINEIRVQVVRYADEEVIESLGRCRASPTTFGRRREVGGFDAYDAATLQSSNPLSPPPDPELVARLRSGENLVGRVYWSASGVRGGAVLKQVGASGPCSLFALRWFAPAGFQSRQAALLVGLTLLAVAAAVILSTLLIVRPLVERLTRLSRAAEGVGEETGYRPSPDLEADEVGDLGRILDETHARIRAEASRLLGREQVLERHLADVAHDLRTPLTSIQIALEQATAHAADREGRELVRRALTDVVYTSELTENLCLATQLRGGLDPASLAGDVELTAIVERVAARFALLGKHRAVAVESAVPRVPLRLRAHPLCVERAVSNLVHNAVSHGGEGSHVAVILEASRTRRFSLTVLDDGTGTSPEEPPALDGETFRSDPARRRDLPGSGLALALTAEICRASGWTLTVEAKKARGRAVTLEGALAQPPLERPETGHSRAPADPPRRAAPRPEPGALPSEIHARRPLEGIEPDALPGEASGGPAPRVPWSGVASRARSSRLWRRLTPRILLAAGIAAVLSGLGMGALWSRFLLNEMITQMSHYTREVADDNLPFCLGSPAAWSRERRVGRFDAYDARTLVSLNPASPPLDPVLGRRFRAGERDPARVFWSWDGQWGGTALRQVAPAGPCSLFQLSGRAAPGSAGRGLGLFVILLIASLGGTMALATTVAVRPLLSRLLRLRRRAADLGDEARYERGRDDEPDEIGRLSRILDRAHDRVGIESGHLRARQAALEGHLADIAHDLRTPLTSAQIALEQATRLSGRGEGRDLLRGALTDIVYTAELAENLRLATQLREVGDPTDGYAVTELTVIVERVVARFSLLGRHRGVTLEGAWPKRAVTVKGHPVWAEQAVANVVHNAVIHGDRGGHVAVVLELVDGAGFNITVMDDGPGVPPTELGRITERSFRSRRARQGDPRGSGLGLAITSEVCRRSGWRLGFAAEEPRGLRVTIEGALVDPPPERYGEAT
jgi:signal transduction histidine kinase